ncbi:MAG: zinc ribbon domain-containing protein [Dehalococcoidia bacterium]
MPLYQFDCSGCAKRVEILFRSVTTTKKPVCPECGSKKLKKVMSRVARIKSTRERFEDIDHVREAAELNGSSDPAVFARWARRVGAEYDEELGTNYRELAERAEAGETVHERVDADHTFRHQVSQRLSSMDAAGTEPVDAGGGHDHVH